MSIETAMVEGLEQHGVYGICLDTPLTEYWLKVHRGFYVILAHSALLSIDGILWSGTNRDRAIAEWEALTAA